MSTISSLITGGVTLSTSGTYASPLTITATGAVEAATGNGVFGPATNAWSVVNQGVVTAPGEGVFLSFGGYVGNSASGLIAGNYGVFIEGAVGTVINSATINGSTGGGVKLSAGGSIDNNGGFIEGAAVFGVYIGATAGTVTNSGTILAHKQSFEAGVKLTAGGSINNSGLIEATYYRGRGVYVSGAAATVTNSGTIAATALYGIGLLLNAGGSIGNSAGLIEAPTAIEILGGPGTVTNTGTIFGTAGVGVFLLTGGTVVDAGTITGANGTAVYFRGTSTDLVVLDPGYSLGGRVIASTTAGPNTVALGGSLGATLTVSYNGVSFSEFQDVLFGAGGNDVLKVSNTSGTLPVTILGFTLTSDIVDLTTIGTNGRITGQSGTAVTIAGSLGSETLKLDGSDATHFTVTSDGAVGTDLGVACFCRGTLVRTKRGEVAVEDLTIGGNVVTASGAVRAIKWIGRRSYDGRFVASNPAVLPICIAAGALADGVPAHDLFVSPEHALYIDELLVPAGLLVNGATIHQVESADRVDYFHVELATQDVILAEGAAAETYVDCDNRFMFQNGAEFAALYPEDVPALWQFCAPRVETGSAELAAIRSVHLERAEALGHRLDRDPDLHLIVDGEKIWPESIADDCYQFAIPAGSAAVELASRSAVPAEVEAGARDTRRLGVPVARIALFDDERSLVAAHDDAALSDGFHADEGTHRWTDGLASLPESWLHAFPRAFALEVQLTPTGLCYRVRPPTRAAA